MAKPYQHLTIEDRIIFAHEHGKVTSCAAIAQMINKHRTTVARELHRNCPEDGRYVAEVTQ